MELSIRCHFKSVIEQIRQTKTRSMPVTDPKWCGNIDFVKTAHSIAIGKNTILPV
jgi:hypothetical protein